MKKKKIMSKVLSLLLVFVLILGNAPVAQILVYADEADREKTLPSIGEIIAFEELSTEIAVQNVPIGTDESKLNLPDILTAKVRLPLEETSAEEISVVTDSAITLSISDELDIPVPVTWISSPVYDSTTAGEYIFTAMVQGFTLSAEAPMITVTVGEMTEGIITEFAELSEDIRWQNTMSPEFPETVGGTIDKKTVQIPVTWEADHPYDAEYPQRGLYVFTAVLGEGYDAAYGMELPRITVFIPQNAGRMMLMAGSGTDGAGYSSETAPTDIGSYLLTISVPSTDSNNQGSAEFSFNIEEYPITLSADNVTVGRGTELSGVTLTYTIGNMPDGKTISDVLSDEPALDCPTYDGNTPGTYPITITGGTATDNYTITARNNGILTVIDTTTYYTVTFDPNGGTHTGGGELTQTVPEGGTATAPVLSRSGYTFDGWDRTFDNVTSDMTVTAIWRKNSSGGGSSGGGSSSGDGTGDSSETPVNPAPVTQINSGDSTTDSNLQQLVSEGETLTVVKDEGAKLEFDTDALKGIIS